LLFVTPSLKQATFPFSESVSVAAKAPPNKNSIMSKTIDYGIHSHYLAVQLYDVWTSDQSDGAVDNAITNFQKIVQFEGDEVLKLNKMMFTSLLSNELDHFLES